MQKSKNYLTQACETPKGTELNEIYYNCSECSSHIEILSIKNDIIEFKCLNKNKRHKKILSIKEYINNMQQYKNRDIHNDKCIIHDKKNESYCLNCNIHLCNDCLKLRDHFNHNKNNIIEVKPNQNELNILENIINYYYNEIEHLEQKKIKLAKELRNKIDICKNELKIKREKKIHQNENKKEKELNLNKKRYLLDVMNIKKKYEKEIKLRKYKYLVRIKNINDKYKSINEKNDILFRN